MFIDYRMSEVIIGSFRYTFGEEMSEERHIRVEEQIGYAEYFVTYMNEFEFENHKENLRRIVRENQRILDEMEKEDIEQDKKSF